MDLKNIKKENVTEQVYEQLKTQLLTGEWKPGDKIPSENQLTTLLGVSRVTVRQALQKLAVQGLIQTRLGEGSYVSEISPGVYMHAMLPTIYLGENAVSEVLDFRALFETAVTEMAAEKITEEDLAELKSNYEKMKKYSVSNIKKHIQYDVEFHCLLGRITGNSLIIELYDIIKDVLIISMESVIAEGGTRCGVEYHKQIIELLEKHDIGGAKDAMKDHVIECSNLYKNRANKVT